MAAAFCRDCKRGANENTCPHCGGVMLEDEWPHSQFERKKLKRKPSFFTPDQEIRELVEEGQRAGRIPKYKTIDGVRRRVNAR